LEVVTIDPKDTAEHSVFMKVSLHRLQISSLLAKMTLPCQLLRLGWSAAGWVLLNRASGVTQPTDNMRL